MTVTILGIGDVRYGKKSSENKTPNVRMIINADERQPKLFYVF
jgi:hypothetical protein